MTDHDDLLTLSADKWTWMSQKETSRLAGLFHDDAVFVHMGATFTAEQELDVISSGRIHYRDVLVSATSARIAGDTGIVLTTMEMTAIVAGNEVTNPFTTTEVFVRLDGVWRLLALSFTKLITPA